MQKNKFVHEDLKAVCNSAAKKLMALVLATTVGGASFTGINLKFVACAQDNSMSNDDPTYKDEPIYEEDEPVYEYNQEPKQGQQPHLICDDHHTVVVGNGPTTVASTGPTAIRATSSLSVNPGISMTLQNGTTFEVEATAAETLENLSNAAQISTNGLRHRGGEMRQVVSTDETVDQRGTEESGSMVVNGPEDASQTLLEDLKKIIKLACCGGCMCGGVVASALGVIAFAIFGPNFISDSTSLFGAFPK